MQQHHWSVSKALKGFTETPSPFHTFATLLMWTMVALCPCNCSMFIQWNGRKRLAVLSERAHVWNEWRSFVAFCCFFSNLFEWIYPGLTLRATALLPCCTLFHQQGCQVRQLDCIERKQYSQTKQNVFLPVWTASHMLLGKKNKKKRGKKRKNKSNGLYRTKVGYWKHTCILFIPVWDLKWKLLCHLFVLKPIQQNEVSQWNTARTKTKYRHKIYHVGNQPLTLCLNDSMFLAWHGCQASSVKKSCCSFTFLGRFLKTGAVCSGEPTRTLLVGLLGFQLEFMSSVFSIILLCLI